jgi:hypothetical protein
MSNAPKPRKSYSADISHISQLIQSVERDVLRDETWRLGLIASLKIVLGQLLNAPEQAE